MNLGYHEITHSITYSGNNTKLLYSKWKANTEYRRPACSC